MSPVDITRRFLSSVTIVGCVDARESYSSAVISALPIFVVVAGDGGPV